MVVVLGEGKVGGSLGGIIGMLRRIVGIALSVSW